MLLKACFLKRNSVDLKAGPDFKGIHVSSLNDGREHGLLTSLGKYRHRICINPIPRENSSLYFIDCHVTVFHCV